MDGILIDVLLIDENSLELFIFLDEFLLDFL